MIAVTVSNCLQDNPRPTRVIAEVSAIANKYQDHLSAVLARDNHVCGLCGFPVAVNRKFPHPLSPSLDHILPRSKGGSDDPANLQAAHLVCNISKGPRSTRGPLSPRLEINLLTLAFGPPGDDTSTPDGLPSPTQDDIGIVFDRAMTTALQAVRVLVEDREDLCAWAAERSFPSREVAADAIRERIGDTIPTDDAATRLALTLAQELSKSWFLAKFFKAAEGPDSADDEFGWLEIAEELIWRVEDDEFWDVAIAVAEAVVPENVDALAWLGDVQRSANRDDEPGFLFGHHHREYHGILRALAREQRDDERETLLRALLQATEAEGAAQETTPVLVFHMELADLCRAQRRFSEERDLLVLMEAYGPFNPEHRTVARYMDRLRDLPTRLAFAREDRQGYALFRLAMELTEDRSPASLDAAEAVRVEAVLREAVQKEMSDYQTAAAYRPIGEFAEARDDLADAIASYHSALVRYPNIGLKRRLQRLQSEGGT